MIRNRLSCDNAAGGGGTIATSSVEKDKEKVWEMRPGGMLVQKRSDAEDHTPPSIKIRVAYDAARYEISVSSQATFGELKKALTTECGLQQWEQKLIYKGKERQDKEFLDFCGVKERSKIILEEDPCSREKRFIEMSKNKKIQQAQTALSDISSQVDSSAQQVSTIEKSIKSGKKVAEVQITTLTELLMRQAVKLDNIPAESAVSALKSLQGKRVQKCVETLDALKISNAALKPAVVTTKWETFESTPSTTQYWNLLD